MCGIYSVFCKKCTVRRGFESAAADSILTYPATRNACWNASRYWLYDVNMKKLSNPSKFVKLLNSN